MRREAHPSAALAVSSRLEPLARRLDVARGALLSAAPGLTRLVVARRDRRVVAVAAVAFGASLALALGAPLFSLALGPLVWGVPHLVSDLRHLVLRRGDDDRRALVAAGVVVAAASAMGLGARAALLGAIFAALATRGPRLRRALVAALSMLAFALASASPWRSDAVFLQLHNVLALALWWSFRERRGPLSLAPVVLFALGAVVAYAAPLRALDALAASRVGDLDVSTFASAVSPSVDRETSLRFVVLFAFAQSAHYAVWLHMIPQEDRAREAPLSFRQSVRGLARDLGGLGLVAAGTCAAALLVVGAVSLGLGRKAYLSVAFFHAYLEVIVLAVAFARRGLPLAAPGGSACRVGAART